MLGIISAAAMLAMSLNLGAAAPKPTKLLKLSRPYAEIQTRYNNAASATASLDRSIIWIAGRCYNQSAPTYANGNLLIVETRRVESDQGPVFDRDVSKVFVLQDERARRPDHFDNLTPQLVREIESYLDRAFYDPRVTEAAEVDAAYTSVNEGIDTRWSVREDDQYKYVRVSRAINNSDFAYCYFFKTVR